MTAIVEQSVAARARVDRIKTGTEVIWSLIVESYQARDWQQLGYASWDEMCTREFGTSRIRLPREERADTVQSLRESGLSLRAIASATGEPVMTVQNELARVRTRTPEPVVVDHETGEVFDEPDGFAEKIAAELAAADSGYHERAATLPAPSPPAPVTGLDGKTYKPASAKKPNRKALTETASTAGWDIRKATERIERIVSDDRYAANEKQVANVLRGHLLYVAETVAAVLDQLPDQEEV